MNETISIVNKLIPNGYFKIGLSKPSYGLKIEDHTTFIRGGNIQLVQGNHREGMPFIPTLENVGLMELGLYFGDTFIYLLSKDSHLLDMAIMRGSVTNMCQTTACQASAWGVIVSGL